MNDECDEFTPYRIAATGSIGRPTGQARWTMLASWTSTPVDSNTITCDVTGLEEGMPIRYRTVAGGATYFYAVITNVDSSSIDIAGPSLTGKVVVYLAVGTPEMVVQVDLFVGGLYAVSNQNILAAVGATYLTWLFSDAFIVGFKAWNNTNGAGTAVVNMKIGSNAVAVAGITPTSSGVTAGVVDATKYAVVRGDAVEIAVTTTDATARDLTINASIVLA